MADNPSTRGERDCSGTDDANRPIITRVPAADGMELAVARYGGVDRPAVVLLHGGGQTRHSWTETATDLAKCGYHVLSYDLRGHGDSGWAADGDYSLDRHAEDLLSVLGARQGPFAFVGASLGGATAIHAVARGARPAALVVVDLAPNAERAGIERIRRFMLSAPDGFASIEEAAAAVARYNPGREPPRDPQGLRRNLRLKEDGRLHWHWDPAFIAGTPNALQEELDESSRALSEVGGIQTLLIRGLRSDVVSDATVAGFRRILPSLEVLDVAEAGHMVAGDRNHVFAAGLRDFLGVHMPP